MKDVREGNESRKGEWKREKERERKVKEEADDLEVAGGHCHLQT